MIRAGMTALALTLSAPALNAQDTRLVERLYDPDRVVTIEGRTKVQASIEFGEDEVIENVAVGDSSTWQITPNKRGNLLFLKPLSAAARTNMTVVTNKHTYYFDLVASPRAKPLYALRFTYPEPVEPEPQTQLAEVVDERPNAIESAAAGDPFAVLDPDSINRDWRGEGDSALMPARAYDDGEATFLTWEEGQAVPAILVKDREGLEGPVNFVVRGNTVVVDGVPAEIILRSGDQTATLAKYGDGSAPNRTVRADRS